MVDILSSRGTEASQWCSSRMMWINLSNLLKHAYQILSSLCLQTEWSMGAEALILQDSRARLRLVSLRWWIHSVNEQKHQQGYLEVCGSNSLLRAGFLNSRVLLQWHRRGYTLNRLEVVVLAVPVATNIIKQVKSILWIKNCNHRIDVHIRSGDLRLTEHLSNRSRVCYATNKM